MPRQVPPPAAEAAGVLQELGLDQIVLRETGTIQLPWTTRPVDGEPPATARWVWDFGLPHTPPAPSSRAAEGGRLRVLVFESSGIRYTQTSLVTAVVFSREVSEAGEGEGRPVVLVHLEGENLNSEYTDAEARLALEAGPDPVELRLDLGIVYRQTPAGWVAVGGIDVPAEGIRVKQGRRLEFAGHMPPGLSGHMTFKLLLSPIEAEADLERLRLLNFDEESRRLRRRSGSP